MYQGLPSSLPLDAEQKTFIDTIRRFVDKDVQPFIDQWEEDGTFPRELYGAAAELGMLGLGFPEQYGGLPSSLSLEMAMIEQLARAGSGGLLASLFSHTIGAPPIMFGGSEKLKQRLLPAILSGEKISALAITEPSGGSDVANLTTRAVRDGEHYVVDGSKIFITSGMRADVITVAVRTGGPGAGGVSMLVVDGDTPGLTRTPLKKMGWWCSDTAQLHFDQCRVPATNLLGQENGGFALIMFNFNHERLMLAMQAYALGRVCLDEASEWAMQRVTFGKRLVQHQAARHKLVDMATRLEATRTMIEDLARRMEAGEMPIAQVCMVKNFATQTLQFCADQAVQLLGGMGFMRGTKSERIYREVKVYMIGGGAEDIMSDLAARQLGWH
jgi:acyl-CoA dehydrogenase